MATSHTPKARFRLFRRLAAPLITRPRLLSGIVLGVLVGMALHAVPNPLRDSTRFVLAWDATCLWVIFTNMRAMHCADEADIRRRAAKQDEGRGFIIALSIVAAAAAIVAIAMELGLAKTDHGLVKALRVMLAFGTAAASWLFVHMVFALHYAHEYYDEPGEDPGGVVAGGLSFPGGAAPDYWDFLHFSVVIGLACQTADISFTSQNLRQIGTVHGVVSFVFNTVILALSINLAAGLF